METRPESSQCSRQGVAGILLAAGRSNRMGVGDKLLARVDGVPAIARSFSMFELSAAVCCIAAVTNASNRSSVSEALRAESSRKRVLITEGGDARRDSVRAGIEALDDNRCIADLVAVHDGARPLATVALLEAGMKSAEAVGAATPVVPITDSLKRVEHGLIAGTVARDGMFATQTPQVFRRDVLTTAHDVISSDVKDDAEIVELAGGLVSTFPGDAANIKLTTPPDIVLANVLIGGAGQPRQPNEVRYGVGYDVHKLVNGGPLRLGGADIEFDMHLEGHSDGDVLMHAIASAILGACKQGDLGSRFPSSDPQYFGMASSYFVRQGAELAADSGWRVGYIDSTVIAPRPRLSPHYDAMEEAIATAAGLKGSQVNVKSTTTDGLGSIGAGDGIGAQAVATVEKID